MKLHIARMHRVCPWCPDAAIVAPELVRPGICDGCAARLVAALNERHPGWQLDGVRVSGSAPARLA